MTRTTYCAALRRRVCAAVGCSVSTGRVSENASNGVTTGPRSGRMQKSRRTARAGRRKASSRAGSGMQSAVCSHMTCLSLRARCARRRLCAALQLPEAGDARSRPSRECALFGPGESLGRNVARRGGRGLQNFGRVEVGPRVNASESKHPVSQCSFSSPVVASRLRCMRACLS